MCCKWLSVVGFQLSVKDFRFCNHLRKLEAPYKVVNCYMKPLNSQLLKPIVQAQTHVETWGVYTRAVWTVPSIKQVFE